jgi:hypothetical protein
MYAVGMYADRDPPFHLINLANDNPIKPNIGDTAMAINIDQLWDEKTKKLSGKVWNIARGDEDLYQEGMIGIHDGLVRDPHATDSYLLQSAKFAMGNYKNKGKSLDNGTKKPTTKKLKDGSVKTYSKVTFPIYIDAVMKEFGLEFPDYSYPPDILAIDKICAETFYNSLDKKEAKFIACIKTMGNYFYNPSARRTLKISKNEYYRRRQSAYQKFIEAFEIVEARVS